MDYIAQLKDYWIAPNAIHISLNALGDANRIQCSVASGAVIMCYIYGTTNDGLGYDNGHQYRTWPVVIAPTYFNTNTQKYVYVAIPRNQTVSLNAMVVFPSEQLDIYGKNASNEQIGSSDYFFIWLQGIISEVQESNNTLERQWTQNIDYGLLDTDQARDAKVDDTTWYSYSHLTDTVTFLKEIVMNVGSSFRNLFLGPNGGKELTSVATDDTTPDDSATAVATPAYLQRKYLRKDQPDTAYGKITFNKGYHSNNDGTFGQWIQNATGAAVYQDEDGNWHIEADFLYARKKLTARELQIEKISHVGGQMLLTAANMLCDYVVEHPDFYRCYFYKRDENGKEISNMWQPGDQAIMQSFNVEKWNADDDRATTDGLRNRYYWRLVVSTSNETEEDDADFNQDFDADFFFGYMFPDGVLPADVSPNDFHFIDLSKTDYDTGSDVPEGGDTIVQLGNRSDRDRQNAILISGAGQASPSIDEYTGIDSYVLKDLGARIKPGDNRFTGLVQMRADSTINGENILGKFDKVEDDIEKAVNGLTTGNENLLRNTGFTGDFTSMDVLASQSVNKGTPIYSDPLQYWDYNNAQVATEVVSASGFAADLSDGYIQQQVTKDLTLGQTYCLSFRGSGVGSVATLSLGGVSESIVLDGTVRRYTRKIVVVDTSKRAFRLSARNAHVMEIMVTEGTIPNTDWIPSPLDNDKTLAYYQNLVYLANAIANASTSILGGLILTQMIRVGNYRDGEMTEETGGMSGLYTSNNSPFLWGGGNMEQAFYTINKYLEDPSYQASDEEVAQMAKFVVTHGGRAILNDIILRGYVYAQGGVFNGTVYAKDGIFNGTVHANAGEFAGEEDMYKLSLSADERALVVSGPTEVKDLDLTPAEDAAQVEYMRIGAWANRFSRTGYLGITPSIASRAVDQNGATSMQMYLNAFTGLSFADGLGNNPTIYSPFAMGGRHVSRVILGGLPTSDNGLVAGQVWNDNGTLKISDGSQQTYIVSGVVTDGTNSLSGVVVSLGTSVAVTDANGSYSFSNVEAGNYTLSAAKNGYTFTPTTLLVNGDTTHNIAMSIVVVTYTVSGVVTDGSNPLSGVVVTLGSLTTTTGSNGSYSFANVDAGSYTLSAAKSGYTFTPITVSVTGNTTQNITMSVVVVTYTVSGVVTDGTNPLSGVVVTLGNSTATTGSDGSYTISNVTAGTYTLSASKSGYSFTPISFVVSNDVTQNIEMLPYDAEVEYIANTQSQYINTNYIPTGTGITIVGKFYLTSYSGSYACWFAAYTGEAYTGYRIARSGTNNASIIYTCGGINSSSGSASIAGLSNSYEFELSHNQLVLNGNTYTVSASEETTNTAKLMIFKSSATANTYMRGRVYYFKVYDGDTLVMDLIPVRKGTTGYLYDKVSGTLFGNAGSGSFTYGNDI